MSNDNMRLEALLEALQASKRKEQEERVKQYRRNWWIKIFPIWGGVQP